MHSCADVHLSLSNVYGRLFVLEVVSITMHYCSCHCKVKDSLIIVFLLFIVVLLLFYVFASFFFTQTV